MSEPITKLELLVGTNFQIYTKQDCFNLTTTDMLTNDVPVKILCTQKIKTKYTYNQPQNVFNGPMAMLTIINVGGGSERT
jgi:hypothetical protein